MEVITDSATARLRRDRLRRGVRLFVAAALLSLITDVSASSASAQAPPEAPTPRLSPSCEITLGLTRFALSPDGLGLAMVDERGRLVLLRLGDPPRVLLDIDGETELRKLQFSGDGSILMVSTPHRHLALDVETLRVLHSTPADTNDLVAFASDARRMVAVSSRSRGYNHVLGTLGVLLSRSEYGGAAGLRSPAVTVNRIDLASGSRARLFKQNGEIRQVLIDASGNRVVILRDKMPSILVFDGATAKPTQTFRVVHDGGLALAPDGRTVAYGGWKTNQIVAIDLQSGREVQRYAIPGSWTYAYALEYSRDGSRLLAGTGGELGVWDSGSGRLLATVAYDLAVRVEVPTISSNGMVVAVPTRNGVLLYDVPSQAQPVSPAGRLPEGQEFPVIPFARTDSPSHSDLSSSAQSVSSVALLPLRLRR